MKTASVLLLLILCACASSGVVPLERDTLMLTKQSAGGAFGSPAAIMADLYVEANAHCAKSSRVVETVQEIPRDGIPFVRIAGAELRFRCVPK